MKTYFFLFFFLTLYLPAFPQKDPLPTGKLVDIGGYRLHIDVRGKGSPSVIMIAGSQAFSLDWALIVPEISKITQVCIYDRPALAWSDPALSQELSTSMYMNYTPYYKMLVLNLRIF